MRNNKWTILLHMWFLNLLYFFIYLLFFLLLYSFGQHLIAFQLECLDLFYCGIFLLLCEGWDLHEEVQITFTPLRNTKSQIFKNLFSLSAWKPLFMYYQSRAAVHEEVEWHKITNGAPSWRPLITTSSPTFFLLISCLVTLFSVLFY